MVRNIGTIGTVEATSEHTGNANPLISEHLMRSICITQLIDATLTMVHRNQDGRDEDDDYKDHEGEEQYRSDNNVGHEGRTDYNLGINTSGEGNLTDEEAEGSDEVGDKEEYTNNDEGESVHKKSTESSKEALGSGKVSTAKSHRLKRQRLTNFQKQKVHS
jgi:hypothetical protein